MNLDPAVQLAFSVHAHRGAYALLLGSGISRAAQIPTGWEVLSDLIGRCAAISGHDLPDGDDPVVWYRNHFDEEPHYSTVIERLAPRAAERTSLLKRYFEPTEEERAENIKVPTAAHKAIAELVRRGYLRVIITTNFDRLLEQALQTEGVQPTVVYTPDQMEGMMPLDFTDCLVAKIHGDYLDTRLRNTDSELAAYDLATNVLLDRILHSYGLIVCGWSADWDPALRDAICRNTRFVFSSFWMACGEPAGEANQVIAHRQATVVPIEAADQAFTDLKQNIDAIEARSLLDPVTPSLAVQRTKRLLKQAAPRIDLEDFVVSELTRVRQALGCEHFPTSSPHPDERNFAQRVKEMEVICSRLVPMLATLAYWGDGEDEAVLTRCLERVATVEPAGGMAVWLNLRYYPVTLAVYAVVIAACCRKRWQLAKCVLIDSKAEYKNLGERALGFIVAPRNSLDYTLSQGLNPRENGNRRLTPASDWLVKRLESMLRDILGGDVDFEDAFDRAEFLMSVASYEVTESILYGRYLWHASSMRKNKLVIEAAEYVTGTGRGQHPLLAAGFLGGDAKRLQTVLGLMAEQSRKMF